ncbi:MAG: MFS transporter, partial [Gammaproteobacteria bacterium]
MYFRLSGFYFCYFAALGALIPYWSLYLKSLGFDAGQIGALVAILMATKIIAPYVWGWIADHSGRPMLIVRLASLLSLLAFSGVYLGQGFWWLALVMAVFSFFWNASLPQFEAFTMGYLGAAVHRYSIIRLWGSIGFILSVGVLGFLLQRLGAGILPAILLALLAGIWLSSLLVKDQGGHQGDGTAGSILEVLRQPVVRVLLLVCFLMQLSHGPYYTFYSIYLEDHGYGRGAIGQLWALGVLAEIAIFLVMHRLLPRFGVRRLLLVSLILTSLRWLLLALFVELPLVMVFSQVLHAASFGLYHAVAISLIHRFFPGRRQGRGQALYSSLSFGAGGALGS